MATEFTLSLRAIKPEKIAFPRELVEAYKGICQKATCRAARRNKKFKRGRYSD